MFGDGIGTGTDGIHSLPNEPRLMWSATWNVSVYSFTSNYKELNMLNLTLIHLQDHGNLSEVRETTIFYFTDNSVTYFIAISGSLLHTHLY